MSGALVEVPGHVWDALGAWLARESVAGGVSSCEIKTSARGVDIGIKVYSGSDVHPATDAAMQEYLRVRDELESALMERGLKVA